MTVRAHYRAAALPDATAPHDRVQMKLHYPAAPQNSEAERNTGVIPVEKAYSPLPVVVIMPGINVGPESYGWLAHALASAGMLAVTYQIIAEEMPGHVSLTPGLDLARLSPQGFGTGPSSTALGPIIAALNEENDSAGPLSGHIDTGRLVIGGHSAGGTVALLNNRKVWFAGVLGAFAYAAHTGAATALGHPADTVLPTGDTPVLIMGGTEDGVIAASAGRYGDSNNGKADPAVRLRATFDTAVPQDGRSHLVLLDGANHFSFSHPADHSTGRAFLEGEGSMPGATARALMARMVVAFARQCFELEGESIADVLSANTDFVTEQQGK